ncbi:MAG: lysophospholipid acyltransferase family protein [Bdellovibrionota bacterium]
MISRLVDYPGPLWKIYSVMGMAAAILWMMLWGPLVIVLSFFGNRPLTTWMVGTWNRGVLRIFRIKVRAKIDPSYDPARPCLLVSNHQSHLDIPVIYEALRGHVRMVAKQELFKIPIFGQALKFSEFVPVDRGNREAGREAAKKITERIRSGLQIWVAPEGTRSDDGKLQPFKSGAFGVAIDAGVPIQPLVVKNAYKVIRKHERFIKIGMTIDFEALPQIMAADQTKENRHHLADVTRAAILARLESE